jgi:SAM-dependent methyltransferase
MRIEKEAEKQYNPIDMAKYLVDQGLVVKDGSVLDMGSIFGENCEEYYKEKRVDITTSCVATKLKEIPFESEAFSVILNLGYTKNFSSKEEEMVAMEVSRLLKPGGLFVYWDFNTGSAFQTGFLSNLEDVYAEDFDLVSLKKIDVDGDDVIEFVLEKK